MNDCDIKQRRGRTVFALPLTRLITNVIQRNIYAFRGSMTKNYVVFKNSSRFSTTSHFTSYSRAASSMNDYSTKDISRMERNVKQFQIRQNKSSRCSPIREQESIINEGKTIVLQDLSFLGRQSTDVLEQSMPLQMYAMYQIRKSKIKSIQELSKQPQIVFSKKNASNVIKNEDKIQKTLQESDQRSISEIKKEVNSSQNSSQYYTSRSPTQNVYYQLKALNFSQNKKLKEILSQNLPHDHRWADQI